MTQPDNLTGPGVPHNKGGLPSGTNESKQPKSIVSTLQQENWCNQVKLIPLTCCGDVIILAGDTHVRKRCLGVSTWNTLIIKHRGIWHSTWTDTGSLFQKQITCTTECFSENWTFILVWCNISWPSIQPAINLQSVCVKQKQCTVSKHQLIVTKYHTLQVHNSCTQAGT